MLYSLVELTYHYSVPFFVSYYHLYFKSILSNVTIAILAFFWLSIYYFNMKKVEIMCAREPLKILLISREVFSQLVLINNNQYLNIYCQ